MSIHVMCFTSSGQPIFSKKRGDCENFPFSTQASLNGVHLFCKTQNVGLNSTEFGDNGKIIWKEVESLIFIAISTNLTEKTIKSLLDKAFHGMILHVGINEIRNIKNIDRFKRELKSYYQMIEKLIEFSETDLLDYNETLICQESVEIQEKLNEFSEQTFSPYCCILSRSKIICATEGFNDLHVADRKLLILMLTQSNALHKDFPIYLPHKSPTVAYRLISLPLIQGIHVCLICGIQPSYDELEVLSQEFWQNDYELLITAETSNPRNFPASIELDSSILGFLLINKIQNKFVISRNIQQAPGKRSSHRMDILLSFFHHSVDADDFKQSSFDSRSVIIKNTEQFYTSDYHKCHALIREDLILCVLYLSAIPTHTMRFITSKTLHQLMQERDSVW
ncbi:unnamed protein product [Diamesa serratosioi]